MYLVQEYPEGFRSSGVLLDIKSENERVGILLENGPLRGPMYLPTDNTRLKIIGRDRVRFGFEDDDEDKYHFMPVKRFEKVDVITRPAKLFNPEVAFLTNEDGMITSINPFFFVDVVF